MLVSQGNNFMIRMAKVSCFFFVPILPNLNQNSIASQTHIIHIVPFFHMSVLYPIAEPILQLIYLWWLDSSL